ncbi:MAG: hypothetical protein IJA91_06620 [Clostridia bacterium]|nr:hypothetical protein [Clostridia bacterium]
MEFYTVYKSPRPVRLSESTRQFAYESLELHTYGLEAMKTPAVTMDHIEGFDTLSLLEKERLILREIAEKAPVSIRCGERLCGGARLGLAIHHVIPATFGGQVIFPSISHLTVDFGCVLTEGLSGIRGRVEASLEAHRGTDREAFLKNCVVALDAFELWHGRYMEALEHYIAAVAEDGVLPACPAFEKTLENLRRVPMNPPTTFHEAVQSLWMAFAFVRLMGNWPGIGRLDVLLGSYLEKDLADGTLTLDEAREILAHFFIKGCEWVRGGDQGSGDAQHYQNIVLGGIDEDGKDVTNAVTYLVLDILEELPIGDFPTTIRVSKTTDEKLLRRVAEVMRHGGGVLAIYNEDLVLEAMTGYGYPLTEARKFANDGCWEVQVPGKTNFVYCPFDSLAILQHTTLKDYAPEVEFSDFDSLLTAYLSDLRDQVLAITGSRLGGFRSLNPETGEGVWHPTVPCTAVSLLEGGCIERGLSYSEGGPVYHVFSPHIGGLADTVNSLYAMKKLVFDDRRVTFAELMAILRGNWEGYEPLRQIALNKYVYYGNDNPEVDGIAADVLDAFADYCAENNGKSPVKFPAGVSTFGRQLEWAPNRLAAPHGRKQGEVLAANASPTPGTDREGVTAMIRSYCAADLRKMVTGAALDCKLLPSSVEGEDGIAALVSIMRGFVAEGGFFLQPDVADAKILRDAQEHPEDYQTLSVRVSGWNARFVTLCREWQDMVIAQNAPQNGE